MSPDPHDDPVPDHPARADHPYFALARGLVPGLDFRPVGEADWPFVRRVFDTFRGAELTGIPQPVLGQILDMQWRVQRTGWETVFPGAWIDLLLLRGEPVGYQVLDVLSRASRIQGVEIALLPDRRGGGVGVGVLRALRRTADLLGRPVHIHHHQDNPVRRITGRLGWRECGRHGPMIELRYPPAGNDGAAPDPAAAPTGTDRHG